MRDIPFHLDAARAKAVALKEAVLDVWSGIRAAPPPEKWRWWVKPNTRLASSVLLVAAAYYVGALIGFSVRFESSPISPIWPPNAILLVALLLVPMRTWWLYLLAVCGAHLLVSLPNAVPPLTAFGLYLTNSAEAVLGAFLVLRFTDRLPWLGNLRRVVIYLACAVVVAPVLTSFADAAVVLLTRWGDNYWNYWLNWETRCVSNILAELTIGPALLLGLTRAPSWVRRASYQQWVEAAFLAVGLLLVGIVVFGGDVTWHGSAPVLVYAVLPLLLWAAIRFGVGGTSAALFGITVLATWSAAQGSGPFSAFSPVENVISLQLYLIGISVPMLILAALMEERQDASQALRASEARYRDLVESQTEMICRYLPDTTLTFVNDAYCRSYGRSREQLLGTKFLDFMDDPARDHHRQYTATLVTEAHAAVDEHEITLPDGTVGWQQWVDRPICDANGAVSEIQAIGRDITDRKRAEQALHESEARFRAAFESAAAGMMLVDTTGRALQVNRSLAEMLGYSQEELLTHTFMDLTYPDDLDANLALFRTALAGETDSYQMEKRLIHKQGHLVWTALSAGVVRDAAGQARYFIGHLQDIAERKQAEEALRASEERYRVVVNNLPHGVVLLFDQDLRHIFADGQGLPDIGFSKEAIEGRTISEAFPTDLSAALAPRYRTALAGTHAAFDFAYAGRTYQTQVLPIHYANTAAGMAVLQDVTEQRRVEILAELDRAKTAFFSNVSHEFRTPLTLLLGPVADVLADREAPLAPRQRQRLELIQRSGLRLHKLVNTLLDFSRIEAGRVQATYEPTDVAALTAELASMFRSATERADLHLEVESTALTGLTQPVYVDRDMWEQIVLNLLSNALKFTFEGSITVTMRTAGEQGDSVELEVRDTGTGIPAEDLPHLFERFYRVQDARARTHEGTGIGLALVQELVRLHGGTVRVTSTLGAGSAFIVTIPTGATHLPADRVASWQRLDEVGAHASSDLDATLFVEEALRWLPEPPPAVVEGAGMDGHTPDAAAWIQFDGATHPTAHAARDEAATPARVGDAYILVADDNADMRTYLARLLSERWEVQAVADGSAALAAASARPPDLVLADVMMPGLDGFALVAALRDNPQAHAVPVILLSARAGEEATIEGLHAGADDYLIKPFSARELLARVQTHLDLGRARREAATRAAQLGAVFEAITDGVLVHDLEGHMMYANRAYRDLLRRHLELRGHFVAPENLLAAPAEREHYIAISDERGRDFLPEEWPTERALRGETLTGANAVDEFSRGTDGNVLQVNVAAAPVRNPTGQIIGAVGVFRDVTQRRQLERQVAEQASQLEAIFEAQADGVAVFDMQGRFLRANRALSQLFGINADPDYTARPLSERMERVQLFDEQGQPIPEAQWPHWRVLRGEILVGANAMEARIQTLDGREVWISTTGAPIRGADGQLTGVVLVTRDVTARRQLERQVAEQASQLAAVFEAMTDGVLIRDLVGGGMRTNRAYQDLILRHLQGHSHQTDPHTLLADQAVWKDYLALNPIFREPHDLTPSDERGRAFPVQEGPTERALRGETITGTNTVDEFFQVADGSIVHLNVAAAPIRSPDGQIIGAVGVFRDVTARRALERQVAQQATQLEAIFEAMTEGVFVLDEEGHMTRLNPAGRRLLGVKSSAVLPPTAKERARVLDLRDGDGQPFPPEQLPTVRLLRGEALAGATAQTLLLRTPNGEARMVSLTGAPLRDAGSGRIIGAVGVFRDITELKRTQAALTEQERLFRTLVENSPDIITRFDRNLRHLYVSPSSEAATGIPAHARLGKTYSEVGLLEAAFGPWEQALQKTFATGQPQVFETGYQAADRPRVSQVRYIPEFAADGSVESVLGITSDITDLKQTEEALRQSEERFSKAFHASPTAMAILSRTTRRILDCNTALSQLTGYRRAELLGATVSELGLLAPTNLDELRHLWRREGHVYEVPLHIQTKSREIRSCLSSTASIRVGSEECLIVTTRDVTERERAEEALRAATAAAEAAQREEERRRREAERRERIAESLREVLAILNSDRQVAKTLDYITRQAGRLLNSDAAAIYTTEASSAPGEAPATWTTPAPGAARESLTLQSTFGHLPLRSSKRGQRRLTIGDATIRGAMAERRPVAVLAQSDAVSVRPHASRRGGSATEQVEWQHEQAWDGVEASADYVVMREEPLPTPYRALLAIPIVAQGQVYGGLLLLYTTPRHFSADEVALAMAYGDQIALAMANARLQDHIERAAIETERNRLARELHDTVTQEIFTASVLAESIPRVWKQHRAEAEASLQQLHQLTRGALAALRALLLELRPAVLEQRALADLLRQLAEAMATRSGVPISLAIADDCPPIPTPVKIAFYRIAQEALMNAAKYAQAHSISVRLHCARAGDAIQLEVQDDGHGFETNTISAGHFGIGMMRERAQAVGAKLRIKSQPEEGTSVTLKWAASRRTASTASTSQ